MGYVTKQFNISNICSSKESDLSLQPNVGKDSDLSPKMINFRDVRKNKEG